MESPAMKAAIEMISMPSRVPLLRNAPLPDGVTLLLRIAAGDAAAEQEALALSRRPVETVRAASAFFIEQMLLHPRADSYRVLGAGPTASTSQLRQHMALLIRWLHPDTNAAEMRVVFISRVNRAWDDLKTPERRSAYDRRLAERLDPRGRKSSGRRPVGSNGQARTGKGQAHKRRPPHPGDLPTALRGGATLLHRVLSFLLKRRR